jgi:transcriptional regulator with XRE-family HTH domain
VPTSPSSSAQAARQLLADQLRELRVDAGLTGPALAKAAGWHHAKVYRIENARTPPSADDIRVWCRITDANDRADDLVASLRAAEGMWVEWRRMERTGLKRAQQARLPLYERTRQFRAYSCWTVPGLIQSEDYTRAVLRAVQQQRELHDDVEEAVAVRMERQRVLSRGGRMFAFLVEESVLRNGMGGREVMATQLAHLAEVSLMPSVSLGVVPAGPDREVARAVEDFWIFDSAQVNVELVSGYLTVTRPSEIAMYARTFARLAEVAVYGQAARDLIARAHDKL